MHRSMLYDFSVFHVLFISLTWIRNVYRLLACLKVSAQDKASGKTEKITITSYKGRLSDSEIQRLIREAEENAEQDKLQRERINAKNQLESYLYNRRAVSTT